MTNDRSCPVNAYINISNINIAYYVITIVFCVFLGSFSTALLISGAVLGLMHLIPLKSYKNIAPEIMFVQYVFIAFVLVEIIAAINNPSPVALNEVIENLPFLGLIGIICITTVPRDRLLQSMHIASGLSAAIATLYIVTRFGLSHRIELGTGNANVFALASMVLLALNIAALQNAQGYRQLAYVLTSICAIFLVIMSGSRAMWPAIIIIAIWSLFFTWRSNKFVIVSACSALVIIAGAIFATQSNNIITQRIDNTMIDFKNIIHGDYSGSIGQRFQMYKTGYELAKEKPLLGYGPGNSRQFMADKTNEEFGEALTFSHAHNAFLTSILRAGILGMFATIMLFVAPLLVIAKSAMDHDDRIGKTGLFIMGSTFIIYMSSGVTGLMIGNDIHDALFIAVTSYALYLTFGTSDDEQPVLPSV